MINYQNDKLIVHYLDNLSDYDKDLNALNAILNEYEDKQEEINKCYLEKVKNNVYAIYKRYEKFLKERFHHLEKMHYFSEFATAYLASNSHNNLISLIQYCKNGVKCNFQDLYYAYDLKDNYFITIDTYTLIQHLKDIINEFKNAYLIQYYYYLYHFNEFYLLSLINNTHLWLHQTILTFQQFTNLKTNATTLIKLCNELMNYQSKENIVNYYSVISKDFKVYNETQLIDNDKTLTQFIKLLKDNNLWTYFSMLLSSESESNILTTNRDFKLPKKINNEIFVYFQSQNHLFSNDLPYFLHFNKWGEERIKCFDVLVICFFKTIITKLNEFKNYEEYLNYINNNQQELNHVINNSTLINQKLN